MINNLRTGTSTKPVKRRNGTRLDMYGKDDSDKKQVLQWTSQGHRR